MVDLKAMVEENPLYINALENYKKEMQMKTKDRAIVVKIMQEKMEEAERKAEQDSIEKILAY